MRALSVFVRVLSKLCVCLTVCSTFHLRWKAEERSEADEWINLIKKAILLSDPALVRSSSLSAVCVCSV